MSLGAHQSEFGLKDSLLVDHTDKINVAVMHRCCRARNAVRLALIRLTALPGEVLLRHAKNRHDYVHEVPRPCVANQGKNTAATQRRLYNDGSPRVQRWAHHLSRCRARPHTTQGHMRHKSKTCMHSTSFPIRHEHPIQLTHITRICRAPVLVCALRHVASTPNKSVLKLSVVSKSPPTRTSGSCRGIDCQ